MLQPTFSDCLFLNPRSHLQNFGAAAVIDVGRGQITEALGASLVAEVTQEGADLPFWVAG